MQDQMTNRPYANVIIVPLVPRQETIPQNVERAEALDMIATYWSSCAVGTELPNRRDIDPRGMMGVLEYSFMLEMIAGGLARFRIAGQHLCEIMGMDVRGMPFSSLFQPSARDEMAQILETCTRQRCRIDVPLETTRKVFVPNRPVKMVLLPLMGESGRVDRILGAMVSDGSTGGAPQRLVRADAPVVHGQPFGQPQSPAAAPSTLGAAKEKGPGVARPALRLVYSAD